MLLLILAVLANPHLAAGVAGAQLGDVAPPSHPLEHPWLGVGAFGTRSVGKSHGSIGRVGKAGPKSEGATPNGAAPCPPPPQRVGANDRVCRAWASHVQVRRRSGRARPHQTASRQEKSAHALNCAGGADVRSRQSVMRPLPGARDWGDALRRARLSDPLEGPQQSPPLPPA